MTAEEEMMIEVRKIMAKYTSKAMSEATKRGIAKAKERKLYETKWTLNNLLLDVEYDVLWRLLQLYFNTLNEKQLSELTDTVKQTLLPVSKDDDPIFPPKEII